MNARQKILSVLRDSPNGELTRNVIFRDVFFGNHSSAYLDGLLVNLAGLVVAESRKIAGSDKPVEFWVLTEQGRAAAAAIAPAATVSEPASGSLGAFTAIAASSPEASPQRLLQLAGRHVGDPLDPAWESWRSAHPDWFLKQPKEWYPTDVELDETGYPLRIAQTKLTQAERETRPTTERGWFEWAMKQDGASLEPFAMEMPAHEVANVLRVTKKVGLAAATDIFGQDKILTAFRLAKIARLETATGTVNLEG